MSNKVELIREMNELRKEIVHLKKERALCNQVLADGSEIHDDLGATSASGVRSPDEGELLKEAMAKAVISFPNSPAQ